uniref:SAC domain-containing protein n=1 Tax=Romanomermis culicivorax TaxID=13658 RepID=A0A915KZ64_ROMCU
MVEMELSASELGLTVQFGEHCLFACSQRKKLFAIPACASPNFGIEPLCFVYGIVGHLSLNSNSESYLLTITRRTFVGKHPVDQSSIYKITQVNAIPFHSTVLKGTDLSSTKFLNSSLSAVDKSKIFSLQTSRDLVKLASNSLKEAISDQIIGTSSPFSSKKIICYEEKLDNSNNLVDEILRLFNEDCCFYVSDSDLTSRLDKITVGYNFDERFFWNKHLLKDLLECDSEESRFWIRPVIQGFIEFKKIGIGFLSNPTPGDLDPHGSCEIALISRRCVKRAGTRYIKRGVDSQGFCANYVETEQILSIMGHVLSFIQIRASIPLFWRQLGYKYKPPPILCNSKPENQSAIQNHFNGLFRSYDSISQSVFVVNLIDQVGREKVLGDAYIDYILDYDSDKLTYVAFDFHDHCRGLKFENVNTLINAMSPEFKTARFSWLDKNREFICRQNALFRVNCIDCLDRTNVVQAAFALHVFDCQIRKLGLLTPEESLSSKCKIILQSLWADNGDAISRQYSGTAALKF